MEVAAHFHSEREKGAVSKINAKEKTSKTSKILIDNRFSELNYTPNEWEQNLS